MSRKVRKMPEFRIPKLPNVEQIDFKKMYTTEIDDSVDQYFSKAELAEIGDYEKSRYKNMKRNYLMMLEFGLPAIKPEFMRGPSYRARKRKIIAASSDESSDEEWTPDMNSKITAKKRKEVFTRPVRFTASPIKKTRVSTATKKGTRQKRTEKPKKVLTEEKRNYPFRERQPINFMDVEAPDDDQYLYCEECNKEYDIDCPVHGPLNMVKDTQVPEQSDPEHALHSLPSGLSVRASGIPGAGLGVFADVDFEPRTRFGPYGGDIISDFDTAHASGYCWQIYKDGQPSHFVDAQNKAKANWMRYVNCAPSETDQNLVAFQFKGEIYYRSYKQIPAGAELLVWYGSEYARELGMVRDKNHLLTPIMINGEELFRCLHCRLGFSSTYPYIKHLRCKHGDKLDADSIKVLEDWLNKSGPEIYANNKSVSKETCGTDKNKLNRSDFCDTSRGNRKYMTLNRICGKDDNKTMKGSVYIPPSKENKTADTGIDFFCDICGYTCDIRKDLRKHKQMHSSKTQYKCDVCGKAFTQQGNLQNHLRIHSGERPYKCDVCGKAFTVQCNLQNHLRIHSGERPYKCDVCGKAFTVQCNLQNHLRIHSGERPYKCEVCGKAFTRQGVLQNHLRKHSGERPYKCEVCGKAFTVQCSLQNHLRIHSGERPYKCEVCGKAFTEQCNLQKHLRIHSGERPYKCDVCGKAFTEQCNLQKHLRIHSSFKYDV